jgi:DNA invertase Pin-like site-specific DNA recombinase
MVPEEVSAAGCRRTGLRAWRAGSVTEPSEIVHDCFWAVDLPEANDLTVGIMALVAQQEREAISRRTKEALAVAKARGVRLGNPNGAAALRRAGKGAVALRESVTANADAHARDLASVVADIRSGGATSLRAIAAELNARGMLTRRGGRWHVSTVMNLLDRLGLRENACASHA